MKFRQVRRELPALNLTPLIDIVFLLLIFFMVTTSFSRETRLLVSLPEASGSAENATESIEVLVDKEGGYAINGRRLVNAEVDSLVRGLELESGGDVSLLVVQWQTLRCSTNRSSLRWRLSGAPDLQA